jgi:hypothetical protein
MPAHGRNPLSRSTCRSGRLKLALFGRMMAGFLFVCRPGWAQDVPPLAQNRDPLSLEDVIVTAQKRPEKLQTLAESKGIFEIPENVTPIWTRKRHGCWWTFSDVGSSGALFGRH